MSRPNEYTAIEKATTAVVRTISGTITNEHRANHVTIAEAAFRRIIAGYFERQTMKDWCQLLGIDPDPHDQ